MNTRSTQNKRRWDKFHLLGDYFTDKGWDIIMTGTHSDREYNESVAGQMQHTLNARNFAGLTNLQQLKDLLKRCDLLISVNTFIMHLGVMLKVPMIAIVGATEPSVILPKGIPFVYSEYCKDIPLESVTEKIDDILNLQADRSFHIYSPRVVSWEQPN
jgi:ADP-heptose:LPS heptosyltransferase